MAAKEMSSTALHGAIVASAYRYYALAMMTAVYMFNLVDRGLVILLLEPIKQDLKLTDTQLGFLTGIAFGIFYSIAGLPLARWADRGNRSTLASLAIGLWGLTVMACVLVTNYGQLVMARIAAAVGEAGCKPPTYSLIGDYFPEPRARLRAMSIYLVGSPLSNLLSLLAAGWINERYGWRITFFLMGVPGIFLAVLVKMTVVEPRAYRVSSEIQRSLPSLRVVLTTLWRQRSFRHLCLALILYYLLTLGMAPWYAAFLMRSHGMGTAELGLWMGLIFSLTGVVGVLAGGYVANRWFANNEGGQMRLSAVTVASVLPCFIAFLTIPDGHKALIALIPILAGYTICLGPTYTLMQRLVSHDMRATMMAVVMFLTNLIGFGIGPQIVGIVSDALRPSVGSDSLRYAMMMLSVVALWSAYHFWQVGLSVAGDLEETPWLTMH